MALPDATAEPIEPATTARGPWVVTLGCRLNVVGHAETMRPKALSGLSIGESKRVQVKDIMAVRDTASHLIYGWLAGCEPWCRSRMGAIIAAQLRATVHVLVENGGTGRTPHFAGVRIDAAPGHVVRARLTGRV